MARLAEQQSRALASPPLMPELAAEMVGGTTARLFRFAPEVLSTPL